MESDSDLLRQYAEAGHQAAFAEVVRRHTDLVYSVALRLTGGDAHLAQDAAQKVFTALAQKAGPLSRHASLVGWLHTTTRYAASAIVRGEHRRRAREQEASTMQHQPATTEIDWLQLQPVLDEAVGHLRASDREAVLLRFFENKSHREIGATLGWNEPLARKRLERALEKLRTHFAHRGVTVSSATLATTLAANSVQAAPVGLAANLATVSLANVTHTGATVGFWKALTMTTKTKTALAAALVLGVVALPVVESRQISQMETDNAALAKENAALQTQTNRLNNRLNKIKSVMLDPALKKSADPNDYLPLSKETIMGLTFGPRNGSFQLDSQSIGLLSMSPTEASKVQDALTALKNRLDTRNRLTVHQILPGQADQSVLAMEKRFPGQHIIYEIPPMSEADQAAQQQWFTDGLTNAIGTERAAILFQKISQDMGNDNYWLTPEMSRLYMLANGDDPNDSLPKAIGGALGITATYYGDKIRGEGFIHPELSYFFDALRNGAQPPPPPPEPSRQYQAVYGNLLTIHADAIGYMVDNNLTQVSYAQLIADPKSGLKPAQPIVGESYDSIIVHLDDPTISIQVPGEGLIVCPKPITP